MTGGPVGARSLTILHAAEDDSGLRGALNAIQRLSEAAHVGDFLIVWSGPEATEPLRLPASRLDRGELIDVELLAEVAKAGEVDHLEVFSACSGVLAVEPLERTAETTQRLIQTLIKLAPEKVEVADNRVYLPSYGNLTPAPEGRFLTNAANSNLIVIPEDRQSAETFARPLTAGDSDEFGWHCAVEVLSVAGLWSTVDASPLRGIRSGVTGTDDVMVRLARSTVRCAIASHPSIRELMGSDEGLPVPHGFQPAPDPFHFVAQASDYAHPAEFRLDELEDFDPRVYVEGGHLMAGILRRIWSDIVRLPQTIRQGFKDDFDEATDVIAQTLIGEDAWVGVIKANGSDSPGQSEFDMEAAVARIETSMPPPALVNEPREAWNSAVDIFLGVIDGADIAVQVREAAGSRNFVAVDRLALVPTPADETIEAAIRSLYAGSTSDNQEGTSSDEAPTIDGGETDNGTDVESPTAIETETSEASDLLSQITQRFRRVEYTAEKRVESLLHRLRELSEPEASDKTGVTRAVQVCFWVSIALLVIALATLTPLADRLTFDDLGADNRIRIFALASALLALPVGLLYTPTDRHRAQTFLISFLGLLVTTTAAIVVFAPEFQVPVTGHEVFRWFLSVSITVAVVAAAAYGLRKSQEIVAGWRWVMRRAVVVAGAVYTLSMVIVGINRSEYRPGWFETNEIRLLFTVIIVALVVLLVSAAMVSTVQVQDEYRLNFWKAEFRWLIEEAKEAVKHQRIVSLLTVHWLGTGTVFLRLIRCPYGEGPDSSGDNAGQSTGSESILKFSAIALDLSESGRVAFMRRATPMLAPEAWLSAQYRELRRAFLNEQIVSYGTASGPEDQVRPEHCAYPVSLDEAVSGKARGVRWPFAYRFYEGHLDWVLRESAEKDIARALLDTYLEEPGSWRMSESKQTGESLSDVFEQILPAGPTAFPAGVLGHHAASFTGSRSMTPHVWWPEEVPVAPGQDTGSLKLSTPRAVGSSVLFQAVRVDVSEGLRLDELGEGGLGPVGAAGTPDGGRPGGLGDLLQPPPSESDNGDDERRI